MVGFDLTAGKFFTQYGIFFLSANTGGALGYVIGTGILDPGLAIALEPVVLIVRLCRLFCFLFLDFLLTFVVLCAALCP